MIKRILSIHAHPDDAEILAGGTLALLAGMGHHVTIATMTPGDCGTTEYPADEIAAIRRREAAASASLIDAEYRCAEFRDVAVFNDDAARRRVVNLLRQARPDIVLTASPDDYMCDHITTSVLVRDACFAAPIPNYATGAEDPAAPLPATPHLYYMSPISGVDRDATPFAPDFIVDVASVFEMKKKMLASHASQRNWLLKHHGVDNYLLSMEEWTRACGRLAGVALGEGFRRYKGHAYPQSPLLEDLLGALAWKTCSIAR